ncbi:RagB/SusD family nutrient uptake outer membrane protein [Segetibacter aerophilus]|uniref:Glycan metabolism protein RagB n=1 Tax=Segetibacter aerophilus TaxID=670293 RepID=A0A512BIH7_9BACT|nr:RagB/SusD family nutrient uptake outer membrane protein [Segetibacter aerophilus]GEO11763.1 glycan metabolism protein RagB [Segetibacter aerophilus]
MNKYIMNRYILFYAVLLAVVISSCQKLDLQPKGILGEPELFGNEFGVKKYFTGLYNYLPIEDFNYYGNNGPSGGDAFRPTNYWEAGKNSQGNMSGEFFNTWQTPNNSGFGYWPYNRIREVNLFIQNFPNYKSKFPINTYNALLGEASFLRAFFYFGLAKRYGGVPIIKEVQDPLGAKDSLAVSRNTEYDTWKFIYSDLKFAMDNMPANSERGRANKFVAAALMSRAMLYAGSVAKYTQYLGFQSEAATKAGLAGIDPSKASEFFQYAVDAGKFVETGPYSLYTKDYPDKATNFANLFLDITSTENIFIKDFDQTVPNDTRLRHSYDALMSPQPDMSSFVGAESYPPFDFMELYDMTAYTNSDGTPVRFNTRSDIKKDMEPRMRGTMYFDGDVLRGKTFSIQKGIYRSYNGLAADAQGGSNAAPINSGGNRILGGRGWTTTINGTLLNITGAHGNFDDQGGENNGWGSAYVRKYINPNMATSDVREYRSGQHWIVFRLGEIYLNTAEALYELDKRTEAFDYIEKLRVRAGAKVARPAIDQAMTNIGTINKANYSYQLEKSLQFIRDERERELYGENQWWWDLRRWRTADQVLNQFRPRVLSCYYVANEGKYIYLDETNRLNRTWTASRSVYYEPIPGGEIGKNSKLLPNNPLY